MHPHNHLAYLLERSLISCTFFRNLNNVPNHLLHLIFTLKAAIHNRDKSTIAFA